MKYEGGMRDGYGQRAGQSRFKAICNRRGTVAAFNGHNMPINNFNCLKVRLWDPIHAGMTKMEAEKSLKVPADWGVIGNEYGEEREWGSIALARKMLSVRSVHVLALLAHSRNRSRSTPHYIFPRAKHMPVAKGLTGNIGVLMISSKVIPSN
jgi:hypothetical protein